MPFSKIFGTGGIGSGVIYHLESDRPLGRNESRMAHKLEQEDFCKLHIILHYVSALCQFRAVARPPQCDHSLPVER